MTERVPISKRLLLVNSASAAVTRIVNVAVMIWVVWYLFQRISAEELEVLYVAVAAIALVPVFTTVFTWALSRDVTEAYAQGDDERVTQITSTMIAVLVPVGLVILAVGLVVIWYVNAILAIPDALVGQVRWMFSLLFVQVVVRLVASPLAVGLFVHQRFVAMNIIELASTVLRLVLLVVLFFGFGPKAVWVIVSQVAAYVFQDVGKVIISLRLMPALRFQRHKIRWNTAASLMRFNTWSVANHLAWFLHDSGPPLILNRFATPIDTTTLYAPAMADIQIRNFVQSTTVPLLPVLTAMQATSQLDRLRNSFLRGCRLSLWMVMYFVTCLVVFHDEVMSLVLQKAFQNYAASGIVLALLLAAYLFYLPRMMLLKVAFAQARVRSVILCNLASQICNLGLTLFLVAVLQLGAVGAALSTLLIEVIWHVLFWGPLSAWLVDIPLWRYVRDGLVLGAAPAAACAIGLEVLRRVVEPTGVIAVGLCMAFGLLVYAAVLFFGCLTEADRADLRNVKAKLNDLARF